MSINKIRCKRCYYEWFPRSELLPKYCPSCNSPYWNLERKTYSFAKQTQKEQNTQY
jgi:hypothetical protein